ncbi:MAG: hypothetical protein U9O96_04630 [Candidatus Thermoplasmatota archaeon]|nr:hypothetical protein [Candidatus Thermoplasmatota archaeon]
MKQKAKILGFVLAIAMVTVSMMPLVIETDACEPTSTGVKTFDELTTTEKTTITNTENSAEVQDVLNALSASGADLNFNSAIIKDVDSSKTIVTVPLNTPSEEKASLIIHLSNGEVSQVGCTVMEPITDGALYSVSPDGTEVLYSASSFDDITVSETSGGVVASQTMMAQTSDSGGWGDCVDNCLDDVPLWWWLLSEALILYGLFGEGGLIDFPFNLIVGYMGVAMFSSPIVGCMGWCAAQSSGQGSTSSVAVDIYATSEDVTMTIPAIGTTVTTTTDGTVSTGTNNN